MDKHWFIVRDSSIKTERLLTLVPRSTNCPVQCDPETRQVVLDLFLALQHPYIYPVLDLEFREGVNPAHTFIVLVLPFNAKGSLKDLIYKVNIFPQFLITFWKVDRSLLNLKSVNIISLDHKIKTEVVMKPDLVLLKSITFGTKGSYVFYYMIKFILLTLEM